MTSRAQKVCLSSTSRFQSEARQPAARNSVGTGVLVGGADHHLPEDNLAAPKEGQGRRVLGQAIKAGLAPMTRPAEAFECRREASRAAPRTLGMAALLGAVLVSSCGRPYGWTVERGPYPSVSYFVDDELVESEVAAELRLGQYVAVDTVWAGRCTAKNIIIGSGDRDVPCYEKEFSAVVSCEGPRCTVDGGDGPALKKAKGRTYFDVVALEPGTMRIRVSMVHKGKRFTTVSPLFIVHGPEAQATDGGPPASGGASTP